MEYLFLDFNSNYLININGFAKYIFKNQKFDNLKEFVLDLSHNHIGSIDSLGNLFKNKKLKELEKFSIHL